MVNIFKKIFSWEEYVSKTVKINKWIKLKYCYTIKKSDYGFIRSISNYLYIWNKSYLLKNNPLWFHVVSYKWNKEKEDFIKWLDEKIYENRFKKMIFANKIEKLLKEYLIDDIIPENVEEFEDDVRWVFQIDSDDLFWWNWW